MFYKESLGTRRKGIQGDGPGRACGAGAEPSAGLGPGRGRCRFAGKNLRSGFYILGTRRFKQGLTQGCSVPGERPREDARGSMPRWEGGCQVAQGLPAPPSGYFKSGVFYLGAKPHSSSDGGVDSRAQRGRSTLCDRTLRGGARYAAAADSKTALFDPYSVPLVHEESRVQRCWDVSDSAGMVAPRLN